MFIMKKRKCFLTFDACKSVVGDLQNKIRKL